MVRSRWFMYLILISLIISIGYLIFGRLFNTA